MIVYTLVILFKALKTFNDLKFIWSSQFLGAVWSPEMCVHSVYKQPAYNGKIPPILFYNSHLSFSIIFKLFYG